MASHQTRPHRSLPLLQYVPITQQSEDVRIESIINSEPPLPHPDEMESEIIIEEISHEQSATTRTSNRNRKKRDFTAKSTQSKKK